MGLYLGLGYMMKSCIKDLLSSEFRFPGFFHFFFTHVARYQFLSPYIPAITGTAILCRKYFVP